ncbi:MAG TPA: hypothetical protein VEY12_07205 [Thermoplasmata archaeon]|nr:hypothetical protein [Thermoplasmata archaeon]
MSVSARSTHRLLEWFLVTAAAAVLGTLAAAQIGTFSDAARTQALVASCILLGLAWSIGGWILAPSVETYLGQGALEGRPVIGPSFANPERNRPVLEDLGGKLAGSTDVGIAAAVLGFLLMFTGGLTYVLPWAGLVALGVLLASAAGLFVVTGLPRRPRAAT